MQRVHDRHRFAGAGAVVVTAGASAVAFRVTTARCDTSPQDDNGWRFSWYCRVLHGAHVVDYPDRVTGGGVANVVFLLPIVVVLVGLVVARSRTRPAPALEALAVASGMLVALFVLALVSARAFYPSF